jgi:hypothetical protein
MEQARERAGNDLQPLLFLQVDAIFFRSMRSASLASSRQGRCLAKENPGAPNACAVLVRQRMRTAFDR